MTRYFIKETTPETPFTTGRTFYRPVMLRDGKVTRLLNEEDEPFCWGFDNRAEAVEARAEAVEALLKVLEEGV